MTSLLFSSERARGDNKMMKPMKRMNLKNLM